MPTVTPNALRKHEVAVIALNAIGVALMLFSMTTLVVLVGNFFLDLMGYGSELVSHSFTLLMGLTTLSGWAGESLHDLSLQYRINSAGA